MQDVNNERYEKDFRWLQRNFFLLLLVLIMSLAGSIMLIEPKYFEAISMIEPARSTAQEYLLWAA